MLTHQEFDNKNVYIRRLCLAGIVLLTALLQNTEGLLPSVLGFRAMPLIPEITVEQETSLKWGDTTATVSAGTHLLPGLYMSGDQQLKAKVTSGTGTISVSWREGSL